MAVQIYSSYVGTRAIKKAIADFPKYMRDKVFAEGAYFAARTVVRQARLTGPLRIGLEHYGQAYVSWVIETLPAR